VDSNPEMIIWGTIRGAAGGKSKRAVNILNRKKLRSKSVVAWEARK